MDNPTYHIPKHVDFILKKCERKTKIKLVPKLLLIYLIYYFSCSFLSFSKFIYIKASKYINISVINSLSSFSSSFYILNY